MTTEIEKQFFDTFGIEPKEIPSREYDSNGEICSYYVEYPQITDTHYLKLICIISQELDSFVILSRFNLDEFKREILLGLIRTKYKFYNQVRTLFEEG